MEEQYTTADVARLLGLPEHRIRAYARAGLIGVTGGDATADPPAARRKMRYSFSDLLILRSAGKLLSEGLRPRAVERALRAVKEQLEADRPVTGITLSVSNGRVLASDGRVLWEPESGQFLLRLDGHRRPWAAATPLGPTSRPSDEQNAERPSQGAQVVRLPTAGRPLTDPLALGGRAPPGEDPLAALSESAGVADADGWFDRALDLEEEDPEQAYLAYLRAVTCDPEHIEAMINLGRMCCARGEPQRAAAYFRQAARVDPTHPVALFNLGVTLHDLGDSEGAIAAYETALAHEPSFVDAHYNLAMLLEQQGDREGALGHLRRCEAIPRESEE